MRRKSQHTVDLNQRTLNLGYPCETEQRSNKLVL